MDTNRKSCGKGFYQNVDTKYLNKLTGSKIKCQLTLLGIRHSRVELGSRLKTVIFLEVRVEHVG